jgi:aldehyde:ferredoxin oxidoreductase
MFKLFCRVYQFVFKYAAYCLPWRKPELLEGEGCITKLPELIKKKGISSVLLVTDSVIVSLGLTDSLMAALKESGISTAIYDKTVPNPTLDNIEEAYTIYKEKNCKAIIAFGGGSPMDCAKGVGVRAARPRTNIRHMKGLLKVLLPLPPVYAVPTTAGTGSETTVAAVVVDSKTKQKYAIMDPTLIPRAAVLDPLLTLKLPPSITATTGMDTLTHAVEAYIGRSNTKNTREMARQATKLVFENLLAAYTDGSNIQARENMLKAAFYGGVAFTRAYVGNVHALAHALGGLYGVAHGLANAVILPHVLDDYGESVYKPLAELADVVKLHGETDEQKAKAFIAAIRKLNASMEIPETIECIIEKDIPALAKHAYKEANPTYPVPRMFSIDDFISVYERLSGRSGICGYAGKMAKIDLTTGKISTFMPTKDDLKKYVGGKGIAAKIIYDAFDRKIEAFSGENLIVVSTSPLNKSGAPSSSRFNISTISPLTGLLVSSNCGGDFGIRLKSAGYDALVISGKAQDKTYIHIDEKGIELRDATGMWTKSTSETQELLGKGGKLVIGIAGENLVRYACVVCQERVAGRGGVGAVFGYKNLKGIVVNGTAPEITIPDKEKLKKFTKKWVSILKKHPLTGVQLPELGTAALVRQMQTNKLLGTENFQAGQYKNYDNVSGETLRDKYLVKNSGCITCPIQCSRVVMHEGREIKGPELETIGLLGPNLLHDDLERIIRVNYLCDEYGLDTMSFGGSVGFAMELGEKGLWDNGLQPGNCDSLEELVVKTAKREGIGDDIADGVKRMSEKYGGTEFAVHVKGMEIAAYDPHKAQGMGLGYATANRGGCHLNGGYLVVLEGLGLKVSGTTTRGKAAFAVFFQDLMEAASAGGSCLFTTYAVFPSPLIKKSNSLFVRMINAILPGFGGLVAFIHKHPGLLSVNLPAVVPYPYVYKLITGNKMNIGKFVQTGERLYNLERLVNIRQGLTNGDTLPKRLTEEPQKETIGEVISTANKKSTVQLETMLKKYYRIRRWDKQGIPTDKLLRKLRIDF